MRDSDMPSTAHITPAPRPRTPAPRDLTREVLRTRAVLHEGRRRDELARRARKHQRLTLAPEEARQLPRLDLHTATHDGWPPPVTRSSAARLRELDTMHATCGPLVWLRVNLSSLNGLPLKGPELAGLARELVDTYLDELTQPGTPYTAAVQRGEEFGGTHAHLGAPLAHLRPEYAALVLAARPGPGGGCELLNGDAHAVLMGNRPRDRQKVATYHARDPDGRLDTPGTPAYLVALEEELERKANGHRSPRLSWSRGVTALRRTLLLSD